MKVSYSNLSRLTRWESFQFLADVLNFADSHEEGMPELYITKLAELRDAFNLYDDALVQERRTSPEGLIEAEENRDYAVRKIYTILREYSDYRFDKEKETAANGLLEVFRPYGTGNEIAKMAQDSETAVITNLLQDFMSAASQNNITTLALIPAIDYLSENNMLFAETQQSRRKETAEFVAGVVKTARANAQDEFMGFVDVVNALSIVEGEEKYAELKQTINSLLAGYVATAKQRTKKKEEETPEEEEQ